MEAIGWIACTSAATCVAYDPEDFALPGDPDAIARTNDGGSSWSRAVVVKYSDNFSYIACPQPSICLPIDNSSRAAFSALVHGTAWQLRPAPTMRGWSAVTCFTAALCRGVGTRMHGTSESIMSAFATVTTDGGLTWRSERLPKSVPSGGLSDLSCPSVTFCIAVGSYPTVVLHNPYVVIRTGGLVLRAVGADHS